MNPSSFDQKTRNWATRRSRRRILYGFGGAAFFGIAALRRSEERASGQTETDPVGTPEIRRTFDPLFPPLDPIPIGENNFVIDGKTIFIDPEVAATLEGTPIVPTLVEGETIFINLDVVISAAATPVAAGATPAAHPEEGPCLGNDDSQDVARYNGEVVPKTFVATSEPPVGCLQWNSDITKRYRNPGWVNARRWCSGTLISDDLFLTAGHCFNQRPEVPKIDGTENPIPRTEIASNMHVDFHYQFDETSRGRAFEDPSPGDPFTVIELVEDRLGDLDYAIVRLDGAPGLTYRRTKIAAMDAPAESTICIIGHPRGEPKKVAVGHASEYVNQFVYYNDVDTDWGSSGSGILSSPDGPIIGVHTNGGCDLMRSGNNYGLRISRLLEVSPTLRELAQ